MSRSADSSAPAWPQPFENPNTWRRALLLEEPKERAKAIPRREISTATKVPTVMRTNEQGVGIARDSGAPSTTEQRGALVQILSPHEQEFMEVFDTLGPIVTAQRLATELDCDVRSLRRHELHDLQVKGVIVSTREKRGGYRRVR